MATHTLLDTAGAVEQIRAGNIIAYPTEAVFGLGCDPGNETAVRKLLSLKGRHESAGFVLIASEYSQLAPWIATVEDSLRDKAMQSWPGPITWLFPRAAGVPDFITGKHDTVAVRITAHEPSRALCDAFGGALISSSANHSSAEPARSAGEVEAYFGHYLGGILTGALGGAENPSEIRDLVTGKVHRDSLDNAD
jgi:L-threonylcarbamoyladenylate synthase